MPTLNGLIEGVTQNNGKFLKGPLAQLGLARDGTYYIIAAGRANHAGPGEWRKLEDGNLNFIGIEAENAGTTGDLPWPEVQMEAYRRGVAAILRHVGRSADFCCGHKEYRHPLGFKDDPSFDMNVFRTRVAAILDGTAPPPELIPGVEPDDRKRLTLRRGAKNPLVQEIQRKLGVSPQADEFGPKTEAAVRELQRKTNLVPDGIVGPKTWAELDKLP
jgi:peptidoglycan hydrolase-like protein with peptidoglycan-binding domain